MRLVYLDEAGISNAKQEPFMVVAAVIVDGDRALNGVENALERIMHAHIPRRLHDGFIFHAMEIFHGGKTLKREKDDFIGPHEWPLQRRLAIADDIANVIRKFRLPVAVGFIEREKFPRTFTLPQEMTEAEKTVAAHVACFMTCAMWVETWMRRETENENCVLVVENNDKAKKQISEVQRYHQDKKIESVLSPKSKVIFPLRKIKEDPLFQPKKQSSPLILADFCAYVIKRALMDDDRYSRFLDPIRTLLIADEEIVSEMGKAS